MKIKCLEKYVFLKKILLVEYIYGFFILINKLEFFSVVVKKQNCVHGGRLMMIRNPCEKKKKTGKIQEKVQNLHSSKGQNDSKINITRNMATEKVTVGRLRMLRDF